MVCNQTRDIFSGLFYRYFENCIPPNVTSYSFSERDRLNEALLCSKDDIFERKTHLVNYWEQILFDNTLYLILLV